MAKKKEETNNPPVVETSPLPLTAPLLHSDVKVNPDKTIDYSVGNNPPINLSPDEFQNLQGKSGTFSSSKVEMIKELEARTRVQNKIRQGATLQQIKDEMILAEANKNAGLGDISSSPNAAPQQDFSDLSVDKLLQEPEAQVNQLPTFQSDRVRLQAEAKAQGKDKPALTDQIGAAITGIGKRMLPTAAEIYDSIEKAIGNRKTTRVQASEQAFSDATNTISQDIELVRAGIANYEETKKHLLQAAAAINRLEGTTHGLGKANLRYWISSGKELETSIINEKTILRNQLVDLELAKREADITSAKQRMGLMTTA